MATFPFLSTGAIAQYPLVTETVQPAAVIRFLDGSDQRFSIVGISLRQWQIRLDLLSEIEIKRLETFYADRLGDYLSFDFPDPISGSIVPNCRFAAPTMSSDYLGLNVNSASFWILETRG